VYLLKHFLIQDLSLYVNLQDIAGEWIVGLSDHTFFSKYSRKTLMLGLPCKARS